MDTWVVRHAANCMEFAAIDIHKWPQMSKDARRAMQLPLSVVGLTEMPGKSRQFVVGRPKSIGSERSSRIRGAQGHVGEELPF